MGQVKSRRLLPLGVCAWARIWPGFVRWGTEVCLSRCCGFVNVHHNHHRRAPLATTFFCSQGWVCQIHQHPAAPRSRCLRCNPPPCPTSLSSTFVSGVGSASAVTRIVSRSQLRGVWVVGSPWIRPDVGCARMEVASKTEGGGVRGRCGCG
ncbi:hypothetical protein EDC01DRAFT_650610 [Geopyxis carbonaria]|nr:hypothetical protein EDC01DRAFT_650610 [Geopyxis carbonaria]